MEAQGSILTNKYAEGYPSKRYYGGCEFVDIVENLAISRLNLLFNAKYSNVQPHSGSQANMAAIRALINKGDKILGMSLDAGGKGPLHRPGNRRQRDPHRGCHPGRHQRRRDLHGYLGLHG